MTVGTVCCLWREKIHPLHLQHLRDRDIFFILSPDLPVPAFHTLVSM
jgi:hypothetical protein